jgi:hypothetical protein
LFCSTYVKRIALVVLLAAIACSSPEREAAEARDGVASWSAAGAMLAAEWTRGHVSDGYARSTARVAIKELRGLDAPARDAALRAWNELGSAVERGDRPAARRLVASFRQAAGQ